MGKLSSQAMRSAGKGGRRIYGTGELVRIVLEGDKCWYGEAKDSDLKCELK